MRAKKAEARQVPGTGRDATATIFGVSDTGVTINNNPQVRLRLSVQPADASSSYQTDLTVTVSRLAIPRPGDRIAVRYDPAHPTRVALGGEDRPVRQRRGVAAGSRA